MGSILPSPAIAIVGRHNSGKTTLVERLISILSQRGLDVGSVKHHGHAGFQIDVPGKDSYRHRAAGATETYIVAPGQMAMVKSIPGDMECSDIVARMPGHDVVIVEGYRLSGLPAIEIMRAENERDAAVAEAFFKAAQMGLPLSCDILQMLKAGGFDGQLPHGFEDDLKQKMPGAQTVALVSDIPLARRAADLYGIPCFGVDDVESVANFVADGYCRPRLTVAVQAGGESRRMGRSKALVPFNGRPMISRIVERVLPVADEVLITTNEPDALSFLLEENPEANIKFATDSHKERGALLGLKTAFESASSPYVAVVACDMVFASKNLIKAEYQAIIESGADVCIPSNSHGFEPFHALYKRSGCLEAAEKMIEQGNRKAQSILGLLEVREFTQQEVLCAEPGGKCFINVNTPEELSKVEASLRQ